MDPNRKLWNENHQKLTRALAHEDRDRAIELFLNQHAMLHSAKVARTNLPSFEDELLRDMRDQEVRQIPEGGEHSIAWILFHLTRIEDITMNMLIAGTDQLFTQGNWASQLRVAVFHSANQMDRSSIAKLSTDIDLDCLQEYRTMVARRTRRIVRQLQAKDFKRKVEAGRLERVIQQGAVSPEAMEISDYWGKKTIAGLLLMPPTRHCILHLNEAMRIKQILRR
jgi:hypothetical protein